MKSRDSGMEKYDMNKLETALVYVRRIADGKDPTNNRPMDSDTILNNPNVIRCMFFVKEVLEKVKENGGVIGNNERKERKKDFPFEILSQFAYREDKGISKLIDQIYEPVAGQGIKKISGQRINAWMLSSGYLMEIYSAEFQKNIKVPTDKGEILGLRAERITYQPTGQNYISIFYNKKAQEFLISNMEQILNGEVV
jgi:hypothetical protein